MKRNQNPAGDLRSGHSLVLLLASVTTLVSVTATSFIVGGPDEDQRRQAVTTQRYEAVREALIGGNGMESVNGSARSTGLVSDLGYFPANDSLDSLLTRGAGMKPFSQLGSEFSGNTAFKNDILSKISIYDGWRGPYMNEFTGNSQGIVDGWGHPFHFETERTLFGSSSFRLFSTGKDGQEDMPGLGGSFARDYPASSEKTIPQEDYQSAVQRLPEYVMLHIDPATDDLCNYYLGVIAPGTDLSQPMGGAIRDNCDGDVLGPDFPPNGPGGGEGDGSMALEGMDFNQGSFFTGHIHILNSNPNINLNQSGNPDGNRSGELWLRDNTNLREYDGSAPFRDRTVDHQQGTNNRPTLRASRNIGIKTFNVRSPQQTLPPMKSPIACDGYRWVNLDHPGQTIGDPDTLAGINVNSGYQSDLILPPGTYYSVNMSSNSTLVLGTQGATEPEVYSFQNINMNNCDVEVVGPVEVRVKNTINLQRLAGNADHPEWLTVYCEFGGINMNSGSTIYGTLHANRGTVHINTNSSIIGSVFCRRLTFNSGSSLIGDYASSSSSDSPNFPDNGDDFNPDEDVNDQDETFHASLNFSPTPHIPETREIVSLDELDEVAENVYSLTVDGGPLFFNNRLAHSYQLVIYRKTKDENGLPADSLAGRMVTVFPEVIPASGGTVSTGDGVGVSVWALPSSN